MKMMFIIVYLVVALVSLFSFFSSLGKILKKEKKISGSLIKDTQAVAITIAVLMCISNEYTFLKTNIPDGVYRIDVSLKFSDNDVALSLPGDLHIWEDEEYEDGRVNYGAAEVETTHKKTNQVYFLDCVYFGDINEENRYRIEKYVRPNTEERINTWVEKATVDIGVISAERLGVTWKDNWNATGFLGNAEFIIIVTTGILQLLQYFLLDETRRKDKDRML